MFMQITSRQIDTLDSVFSPDSCITASPGRCSPTVKACQHRSFFKELAVTRMTEWNEAATGSDNVTFAAPVNHNRRIRAPKKVIIDRPCADKSAFLFHRKNIFDLSAKI